MHYNENAAKGQASMDQDQDMEGKVRERGPLTTPRPSKVTSLSDPSGNPVLTVRNQNNSSVNNKAITSFFYQKRHPRPGYKSLILLTFVSKVSQETGSSFSKTFTVFRVRWRITDGSVRTMQWVRVGNSTGRATTTVQ